jgi:hypothetical protein
VPAIIGTYKGSNTAPSRTGLMASFDAAADRVLWWTWRMPDNYASGGTLKLLWAANAVTGSVVWSASVGAVTAADADTYLEHAQAAVASTTTATNTTEARRVNATSITLTMDSAAAGDYVALCLFRDADNGSDTVSVAADLLDGASFVYTSA